MSSAAAIEYQVLIYAPVAHVWQVLTTFDRYGEWNRYAPEARGTLAVGATVEIVAHLGSSRQRVNNRVLEIVPECRLCWVSLNWYQFLVRGTRCRFLEALPDGITLFRESEVMTGPLAPLVVGLLRSQLVAGLQAECESLKAAAERSTR